MRPVMEDFYKWMFWFYDDGVSIANPDWTFNPDEVYLMNAHGTFWMPKGKGRATEEITKLLKAKYPTLKQLMEK